jgi:hypothetical protein
MFKKRKLNHWLKIISSYSINLLNIFCFYFFIQFYFLNLICLNSKYLLFEIIKYKMLNFIHIIISIKTCWFSKSCINLDRSMVRTSDFKSENQGSIPCLGAFLLIIIINSFKVSIYQIALILVNFILLI